MIVEKCVFVILVLGCFTTAIPRTQDGELKLFAPASYDVETTVLMNDVTKKDKEVGYKIKAILDVAPVWSNQQAEFLLKFQLRSPKLHLRGKHVLADFLPYDSVWDKHSDSIFYAHWKNGLVKDVYLDPEEIVDVINYKKSLASLFQFQALDGEYNEADVSGLCSVLYETVSMTVFRKIKRSCEIDKSGAISETRRVSRYTLTESLDAIDALYADELVTIGDKELGLKARTWTSLSRRSDVPRVSQASDLADAISGLPASLKPQQISLNVADAKVEDIDDEELLKSLEAITSALEGDEMGTAYAATITQRVLPALKAMTRKRLDTLLEKEYMHKHLALLFRLLGLAGTRAAHTAVADFIHISGRDPLVQLAHTYLSALALAAEADEWVVLDALRLGGSAKVGAVAESALLGAAAAARDRPELALKVRDEIARGLARCKDESCRTIRLQALGNLQRLDTADILVEHAARGVTEPRAALAALQALAAAPPLALTFARLDKLTDLALDERPTLEVRAAALDLVVQRRAPIPMPLARVAYELHAWGPHELRRVYWQRMGVLAPDYDELSRLPGMLEPHMKGWDAHAHEGSSSVLVRPTGWSGAGWNALLESVQIARGGLLRHGTVTLRAHNKDGGVVDALSVQVWTRGLEAFGGGAETKEQDNNVEPEEAAGGLALTVGGARMRDVTLFNGQAELLSHVWAGTASTPTPVLRALRPISTSRSLVPLQSGSILQATSDVTLALALDAQAQISLWYRTARSELELRAGAAAFYDAVLPTAWGEVRANASATASPRLRINSDLDFYSSVALCVRTHTDAHERRREVNLHSDQGVRRLRVSRYRNVTLPVPGRTLALGRPNDVTCRTLLSADQEQAES